MSIAIVLVGHSNWGKSRSLKALTDDIVQFRYWQIADKTFFIRRMSNDDLSEELKAFIENLSPDEQENVLLTLCPDFDEPLKHTKTNLITLSKKYTVFFFVLQHGYGTNNSISPEEIEKLKIYGEVEVFSKKNAWASTRAKALRNYIESVVKRKR